MGATQIVKYHRGRGECDLLKKGEEGEKRQRRRTDEIDKGKQGGHEPDPRTCQRQGLSPKKD